MLRSGWNPCLWISTATGPKEAGDLRSGCLHVYNPCGLGPAVVSSGGACCWSPSSRCSCSSPARAQGAPGTRAAWRRRYLPIKIQLKIPMTHPLLTVHCYLARPRRASSPRPPTSGQPTSRRCAPRTPRAGAAVTYAVNCHTMLKQVP